MIHRSPSIGAKSPTFCLDIFDFDNASRSRISTVVSNFKKKVVFWTPSMRLASPLHPLAREIRSAGFEYFIDEDEKRCKT